MQVLLGVVYAWSVFRAPLARAYGWSNADTVAPYRYSILVLALAMILGGLWQDRVGPRVVASVGGALLGVGWVLAAFIGHDPLGLILSYGCIVGLGTGFAYVTPIATLVKWFPDRRGLIVGLAVMGVGVSPLVFAPLLELLLGKDPAQFSATIPRTFMIVAAICVIGVIGAAQLLRTPPAGWRPAGWQPGPAAAAGAREHYTTRRMLGTWQFYVLWLLYFLGTSVGLTAIAEASPLVRQMARERGAFGRRGAGRDERLQRRRTAGVGRRFRPLRTHRARCSPCVSARYARACSCCAPPPISGNCWRACAWRLSPTAATWR